MLRLETRRDIVDARQVGKAVRQFRRDHPHRGARLCQHGGLAARDLAAPDHEAELVFYIGKNRQEVHVQCSL